MDLFNIFQKKKQLDESMNKEFFVLKIKLLTQDKKGRTLKKKYWGYIYPTDNWVEVHCFESVNFGIKKYEKEHSYMVVEQGYIVRNDNQPSRMKAKWATFEKRLFSFIIPRNKVFGDKSLIECNPSEEDFKRWKEWHPKDDYHKKIWIEDVECSWIDSHHGVGVIHYFNVKTGKEKIYPLKS